MKVSGTGSSGSVTPGSGTRRKAADGFAPALGGASEVVSASAASAASNVGSLDALMALQGAPDPTERRRRAVKRAGRLLDMLDEVKLAMLDGRGSGLALDRLRGAVREARDRVDDSRLAGLLDEIETRAAVELAKQDVARAAA